MMKEDKVTFKQFTINSNKQPSYFFKDDYIVFNLNSCFTKKNNFSKCMNNIKEALEDNYNRKLNLCNLASMCYRLQIKYDSLECYEFIGKLIAFIKQDFPQLVLTQNNVYSHGEYDVRPIDSLIQYEESTYTIYINNVLLDCLKFLGYTSQQVIPLFNYTRDFNNIIPSDMIKQLPVINQKNLKQYEQLKELILS